MKKSIFTLIVMVVLGTSVVNGKTKVMVVERRDVPHHEMVMKHKRHHKKVKPMVIPRREVTVSKQTLRF